MARVELLGFGFDPSQSAHHFVVRVPRDEGGDAAIEERFTYGEPDQPDGVPGDAQREPRLKVTFTLHKWERIEGEVRGGIQPAPPADTTRGPVREERWARTSSRLTSGKSLCSSAGRLSTHPSLIPIAHANWDGLVPEERWWLYTTVNATTGHPEHGRIGAGARRSVLRSPENPVGDRPFRQYDDLIDPDTEPLPSPEADAASESDLPARTFARSAAKFT